MSSVQPRIRIAESHDYPSCAVVYERAWNGALPGVQRSISVDEFREETKGELHGSQTGLFIISTLIPRCMG